MRESEPREGICFAIFGPELLPYYSSQLPTQADYAI